MDLKSERGYLVLLVDDDLEVLSSLSDLVSKEGVKVTRCASVAEAWRELDRHAYAVVMANQGMEGEGGLLFLRQVSRVQPNSSRILISEALHSEGLIGAIKAGEIFRFLAKPWVLSEVAVTLENAIQRYSLLVENQKLHAQAQALNSQMALADEHFSQQLKVATPQNGELDSAPDGLRANFEHSLGLCFRLISTFCPLVGRQTQAVVQICRAMAVTEYFTQQERHVLGVSSWLYDIGLVALERPMLHRLFTHPETCTPEEHALLRHHPIMGQTLASFVDQLQAVGATVRAHHERFDGTGYPDGLAGENIPWTARCLAVAVAFVQTGMPKAEAAEYLQEESGRGFDPEAVRLFFRTNQLADLPRNVREVMLSELKPGMQLARGILTPSGMLLVPEGQELNGLAIDKLNNHSQLHLVTERILVYG